MNLFLYATVVLIWGTTWIAIYWQLGTVPPLASVFYRFALASCLLAAPALAQTVNLYTTREPALLTPVIDAFTKDTGSKVHAVFLKDGQEASDEQVWSLPQLLQGMEGQSSAK